MNSTELLPCPFCGGHARPMTCEIGVRGTMGHNKWVTITCSMCEINNGGKGGFMRPRYDTEQDAAKAWNTRAPIPAPVERIDGLAEAIDVLEAHMADMGDMAVVLVAARAYLKLQGGE